jgi:hypothetical protein
VAVLLPEFPPHNGILLPSLRRRPGLVVLHITTRNGHFRATRNVGERYGRLNPRCQFVRGVLEATAVLPAVAVILLQ